MSNSPGKVETPYDELTYKIIGVAMAIHNEIGPGFPEAVYHRAMEVGLAAEQIPFQTEHPIDVRFRDHPVGRFELDLVADGAAIIELKATSGLIPEFERQVISYLAASGLPVALLINFGALKLQYKRIFPPLSIQANPAYQSRRHYKD